MKNIGKEKDYDEIYIMMYSMSILLNRGISATSILTKTLRNLLLWYQDKEEQQYLDLMRLQLQAYVNMGHALNLNDQVIRSVLELLEMSEEKIYPNELFMGKQICLTPSQVRSIIGKWRPSKNNPMTIKEVVRDIIEKVERGQIGHYFYEYQRFSDTEKSIPDVYELIVGEDENYFYDVNNLRFYKLICNEKNKGKKNDQNCDFG